jgi:hypothetical protein
MRARLHNAIHSADTSAFLLFVWVNLHYLISLSCLQVDRQNVANPGGVIFVLKRTRPQRRSLFSLEAVMKFSCRNSDSRIEADYQGVVFKGEFLAIKVATREYNPSLSIGWGCTGDGRRIATARRIIPNKANRNCREL